MHLRIITTGLMVGLFLICSFGWAQEKELSELSLEEISKRLENPLSALWSLTFQENFSINSGELIDGEELSNTFFFQPFLPFPVGREKLLIIRPVFPLVTIPISDNGSSHKSGFGDMQLITAFGPDKSNGTIWGIGTTFKLPTASDNALGQGKFQVGPTGLLVYLGKPWTLGIIFQHWTSVAGDSSRPDTNQTDIQYIARRSLPGAWSIGMGPNVTINWEASSGNKVTFPIGLGITKTIRWGKTPIKLRLEPQYSIIKPNDYGSRWNIRLQITPVIGRLF